MGRLFNHSSSQPTATVKIVELEGIPHLCLFAARDIIVGDELLIDYGERRRAVVESFPWLK
jgi:histone-lysine N-methyltransferase SETD8